jgi:adenylosuccinate lyase
VGLENVALWHERDISHSSAERIVLPDSSILLDYMLAKLTELVEGLQVYPERMKQNLESSKGLYFSQSLLLALTRKGAERKSAYEAVQRAAMKTWKGSESFAENSRREPEITARLSESEIDALCSLDVHLRHVDETFRAVGLD